MSNFQFNRTMRKLKRNLTACHASCTFANGRSTVYVQARLTDHRQIGAYLKMRKNRCERKKVSLGLADGLFLMISFHFSFFQHAPADISQIPMLAVNFRWVSTEASERWETVGAGLSQRRVNARYCTATRTTRSYAQAGALSSSMSGV